MSDEDPFQAAIERIKQHEPGPKKTKTTRTHRLSEPEYTIFQRYCRSKGLKAGNVLDDLIKAFLESVQDDLTTEHDPSALKDED